MSITLDEVSRVLGQTVDIELSNDKKITGVIYSYIQESNVLIRNNNLNKVIKKDEQCGIMSYLINMNHITTINLSDIQYEVNVH
jgi:hypothetical protein